MAIKLTQGADAQIVTAATRAGLANTPKDYSNTFQNVVDSYEASMEASAEVWKEIGKLGTGIGMQLKQNAAEWNSTIEKIYDAGGTDALVDDVYDLRDELKSLGPFGGQFGDKETRKKRMQILSKRNKLFAEIDGWGEVLDQAALAAENGGLDERFFGSDLNNVEFVNAIIASNTNNKITDAGNYARVSRDPKTNNLIYTLYKQDGTEVKDNDGNPLTMSLAGFKKIIADAATDTNGVYSKAFSDLFTGAENAGATYGGEYDEYQSGKIRTALNNMTRNPNEIRRGMRTTFGHTNISFYDAIVNGGTDSAKYWSQMMETMTKSDGNKSELKAQGVLTGIKDTDNSGGISQDEVNAQWLTFQTNLLSGENEFSKKAFIDFVDNQMKDAYEFGARQKNKGSKAGGDLDFSSRGKKIQMLNNQYLEGGAALGIYNSIMNGTPFDAYDPISKKINKYSYHVVDGQGGWYQNYKKGDTPKTKESYIGDGGDMGAVFTNDPRFKNIKTEQIATVDQFNNETNKDTRDPDTFDPKTNISTTLITGDDNTIAANLNSIMPPINDLRNPDGLRFEAKGGTASLGFQTVGLYEAGGDIKTYPDTHPKAGQKVKFSTSKGNTKEQQIEQLNTLIDILKTFGLYENVTITLPQQT